MRKIIAVAAGFLLAGILPFVPASAADRGTIEFTPVVGFFEQSYPALQGTRQPPGPVTINDTINPYSCKTATYCDTHKLVISIPEDYNAYLYLVNVELHWDNSSGNNVALWLWDSDEQENRSPMTQRFGPEMPKVIDNWEEPLGTFWFTVVNWTGVNTGYTLKLIWEEPEFEAIEFDVPPRPSFGSVTIVDSSSPFGTRSPGFPGDDPFGDNRPRPSPPTRLVPGPDGELVELHLDVLALGDRTPPQQGRFDPVVVSVVAFLLLTGSVFAFLAIRSRRRALEGL